MDAREQLELTARRLEKIVLPNRPGRYKDKEGDDWVRNDDGTWTDKDGVTKPVIHNWKLVVLCAPFRPNDGSYDTHLTLENAADAIESAVNVFDDLQEAKNLHQFAVAAFKISEARSALASWHPRYDEQSGEITPEGSES